MLFRVGVPLLLLLISSLDEIECKKKSTSPTHRRPAHPNPVHLSYGRPSTNSRKTTRRPHIQTTTPRSRHQTTTRRRHSTTARKHHITTTPIFITTTPRAITRYTTRRTTTPKLIYVPTTTRRPRQNITGAPNRTTTPLGRPPPFNPFFSTSRPKTTHTKPPPYNPFFSSARTNPTTKQPAFNPFFTTSVRPLSSGLGKTTPIPRQPAYNPYFTSSVPPFSPSLNRTSNNKPPSHGSFLNSSEFPVSGRPNKTSLIKVPSFNSSSTHSQKFNNSSGIHTSQQNSTNPPEYPVHAGFNKTLINKPPLHNSSLSSLFNHPPTSTRPSIYERLNKTSQFNQNSGSSKPSNSGGLNKTSTGHLGTVSGTNYPSDGFVKPTNRPSGFVYHPPGHTRNFSQPLQNLPQSNSYPTYPTYPGHNNGHYNPAGSYNPGDRQSQQGVGLTIINNNMNNNNHHVIYPTQHYNGYGSAPSGVTIINNNFDYIYPDPPKVYYQYTSHDTGRTLLGVYLGQQLGKISRPTYLYHGVSIVNDKYMPVYSHYEVHHYYHNKDSVPKEAEIAANTIVRCAGDSTIFCPENTTPLCTNNGAVMCISSNIVPCDKEKNTQCVRSSIPCMDSASTGCESNPATSLSIPCISTTKITGTADYYGNTVATNGNPNLVGQTFCVAIVALPAATKIRVPKPLKALISVPFHYTTRDSGIDPVGYYLGQQLEKLETPSYLYLNYDKYYRYKEKYDHYDIHQYYHNGTIVPSELVIEPETVITCTGDSGTICPQNTRSLCFTDGAVACVTDIESAQFKNDSKLNYSYVNSSIPCGNSTAPMCRRINSTVSITIPCISIAKIHANISNLISSIVTKDGKTKYYNTLVLQQLNSTSNATVPTPSNPRQFCVTILLTPSEKIKRKAPSKRKVTGANKDKTYMYVPSYTYSTADTGKNTLGFYLMQFLQDLEYPTYDYMDQKNAIQQFDHYSVHQYYHGREVIPSEMDLQAESVLACSGDTGTLCPANTTSLCLNDWSIMCVTDVLLTRPCGITVDTNCVRSTVPCSKKSKAPKCEKGIARVHVIMPCISTITVFGDIKFVNNSIYTSDIKKLRSYVDIQQIPKGLVNASAPYDKAQQFCVTIVALPAERRISEGENVLESSKNVFFNFAVNMFGIS